MALFSTRLLVFKKDFNILKKYLKIINIVYRRYTHNKLCRLRKVILPKKKSANVFHCS